MRFALLGDHPDGLSAALAFIATQRHELVAVCAPEAVSKSLASRGLRPRVVGELEELLADPAIEAVIVASPLADRPAELRRSLQSERHVLCVHPADASPDAAYEAAMIQGDTGHMLLPLLSGPSHPAVRFLASWLREPACPIGKLRMLQIEWRLADGLIAGLGPTENLLALPGWDILRTLVGEIAELTAFAEADEISPQHPLPVSGRSESGILFRLLFVPHEAQPRLDIDCLGATGRATLSFARGWPAPAEFVCQSAGGQPFEKSWGEVDTWSGVITEWDRRAGDPLKLHVAGSPIPAEDRPSLLSWQTETRCLELDDAIRNSWINV